MSRPITMSADNRMTPTMEKVLRELEAMFINELDATRKRLVASEQVLAWAYQFAGVYGAPAWILDNLSDATSGKIPRHGLGFIKLPAKAGSEIDTDVQLQQQTHVAERIVIARSSKDDAVSAAGDVKSSDHPYASEQTVAELREHANKRYVLLRTIEAILGQIEHLEAVEESDLDRWVEVLACKAVNTIRALTKKRDELRSQLQHERANSDQLAERLGSALLQLSPDYCKTEGYAKCKAALAHHAELRSKTPKTEPPQPA